MPHREHDRELQGGAFMKVLLVSEGKHEASGALQSVVHRLAPHIQSFTLDRVSRVDLATLHGKGRGFFKRAIRWMFEARKRGFDALVLLIDEDGRRESIRELEDAQADTTVPLRRALGCAIPTFDAWLLADERSLSIVLKTTVSKQSDPETNSRAKATCAALLQSSGSELAQSDFYSEVAKVLDLECLATRCPKGFGVFADRVRALDA
jgi:Domain of unknown function (DUF4276)